jgi:hypothetical protein
MSSTRGPEAGLSRETMMSTPDAHIAIEVAKAALPQPNSRATSVIGVTGRFSKATASTLELRQSARTACAVVVP